MVAVVTGAVLALLFAWTAYAIVSSGGGTDLSNSHDHAATPGEGTGNQESTPGAGTTSNQIAYGSCAAEIAQAERVVAAANIGVSHWQTHVQARTDLLHDRISVAKMRALWKRTRLAGPADQQRFQAALQQQDGASRCSRLAAKGSGAVADCIARSETAARAVAAAEAAMGDWQTHLDHMAAYARGDMTRAQAQHHWVGAWRNAPRNISAYLDARTSLRQVPRCPTHPD